MLHVDRMHIVLQLEGQYLLCRILSNIQLRRQLRNLFYIKIFPVLNSVKHIDFYSFFDDHIGGHSTYYRNMDSSFSNSFDNRFRILTGQ